MATKLRAGTKYDLARKASRALTIEFLTGWLEPSDINLGETRKCFLFKFGPRAAAKRGNATAPKLIRGKLYQLQRTRTVLYLRLIRQATGEKGVRYLMFKRPIQRKARKEWKG